MINTDIPIYGIMILISLIANVVVVIFTYKKNIFSKEEINGALIFENVGIIFGAKILVHMEKYGISFNFNFIGLGLSSYGAVIGAILCLILFGLQYKKSIKDMLFTFLPSIPLMYAIGKIGCFLVGCCHGIKYDGIGSIVYKYSIEAPNFVHLFPVQLAETVVFTFIFIYMIKNVLSNKFTWKTLGISFILCGFAKFSLDYFRMSHVNVFLSLNQIISIVFILLGVCICFKFKKGGLI